MCQEIRGKDSRHPQFSSSRFDGKLRVSQRTGAFTSTLVGVVVCSGPFFGGFCAIPNQVQRVISGDSGPQMLEILGFGVELYGMIMDDHLFGDHYIIFQNSFQSQEMRFENTGAGARNVWSVESKNGGP